MRAYARIRTKDDFRPLHLARGPVLTMEQALERMRGLLGTDGRLGRALGLAAGRMEGRAGAAAVGDRRQLRGGAGAGEGGARSSCGRRRAFRPIYLKPVERERRA